MKTVLMVDDNENTQLPVQRELGTEELLLISNKEKSP